MHSMRFMWKVTERYKSKGFPCCWGTMIGGWRRYSLISSKAFWHSSFHVCGSFFLRSMKMGSQVEVSLAMNWLMYCNRPNKLLISFSLSGIGISKMALILDRLASIPLSFTRKLSNFPSVTQKLHFYGFNLSLYSLIHLKNFLKFIIWLPLSLDFTIISLTYTFTSLCIISCSKAIAILW